MKQTVYSIFDKINEANSPLRVGGLKTGICKQMQMDYRKPILEGQLDPNDFEIRWYSQIDIETEDIRIYEGKERVTQLADIMKSVIDEQDIAIEGASKK